MEATSLKVRTLQGTSYLYETCQRKFFHCFKITAHACLTGNIGFYLILPSLCPSRLLFFFVLLIPFILSAATKATLAAAAATVPVSSDYESVVTDIDEESSLYKAEISVREVHGHHDIQSSMEGGNSCREEDIKSCMLQLHLTFDCSTNLDRQQGKINLFFSKDEIKVIGEPEKDFSRQSGDDLEKNYPASNMTRLPIQIKRVSRKSSDVASARSITSDLPASPTSLASLHSLESELERSVFPGKTLPPVKMTIETNVEEIPRKLETAGNLIGIFSQPKSQTQEGSVQTDRLETVDSECQTLRETEKEKPGKTINKRSEPRKKSNEDRGEGGKREALDPRKVKGFDVAAQTVESCLAMQDDVTARVLLEHVGAIERENREKSLSR